VTCWRPLAAALAAALFVAHGARSEIVEYLHVEANAGSSAGGHFALRIDEWVYDFQNADFGTLRVRRSDYETFRYLYTVLDNRTMHIARINIARESHRAISDRFNRRYRVQNQHFSTLDSLRGDRALLEILLDRENRKKPSESSPGEISIRGAGFFYDESDTEHRGQSPRLLALRDRIEAERGPTYLATRIAEFETALTRLAPTLEPPTPEIVDRDTRPASRYGFSDRYRDLSAKVLALRALENAMPVRPSAKRMPTREMDDLGAAERDQIRAFEDQLESRLTELVVSMRPDWGYALLLGMARLETLRESRERGRWIVLDTVPDGSNFLSQRSVRRRDPFAVELHDRARTAYLEARTHFATTRNPGEPALAWLEESINRYAVFQDGFEHGFAIPIYDGGQLPGRSASVRELPLPEVDRYTLERASKTADTRERAHRAALKRAFGYQLISNNCVTEIFNTVKLARDDVPDRRLRESRNDDKHFDFIPAVAFKKVLEAHPDAEVSEIPSFRRLQLETMYATENTLNVYLRESNTLTSNLYRRNDAEPFFLFFTEDALPLRPFFGALNFAAGIGETLFGVFRAPWDRGKTFTAGLKGATFSLPELAFVNLRKGTMKYAPGPTPRTTRRPTKSSRQNPPTNH
jgi:hypothetical protein